MKSVLYYRHIGDSGPLNFAQTKSGEATPTSPVEQEIVNFEPERLKAFAQDDKATFEELVADDLTMTHTSGEELWLQR